MTSKIERILDVMFDHDKGIKGLWTVPIGDMDCVVTVQFGTRGVKTGDVSPAICGLQIDLGDGMKYPFALDVLTRFRVAHTLEVVKDLIISSNGSEFDEWKKEEHNKWGKCSE